MLRLLGGALVLAALGLGGCVDDRGPYTTKQVEALLAERFPGEAVSFKRISKDVWDCWFEDAPEVVFQVQVAVGGGDPVPALYTYLSCNVQDVFWRYFVDTYTAQAGSLDSWQITRLESGETYLKFTYTNMTQVRQAATELAAFYAWGQSQPHGKYLQSAHCLFAGGALPDFNPLEYDYEQRPTEPCDRMLEACADTIRDYYAYYLLACADFSQDELLAYAAAKWDWTTWYNSPDSVWRGEEELPLDLFAGIYIHRHYSSPMVSFGGVYVLANRLGLAVSGTPEHFSFIGTDGKRYEFCYDFYHEVDTAPHGSSKPSFKTMWYYFCDGERVEPEPYLYTRSGTPRPEAALNRAVSEKMLGIRFVYESSN